MEPFGLTAIIVATTMATLLAYRAYRKRSLTPLGSIAAFMVAFLLVGSGLRGFNLLVFYGVAMKATKYKHDIKTTIDGSLVSLQQKQQPTSRTTSSSKTTKTTASVGVTRGVSQVLACSLLATILSVIHVIFCGKEQPLDVVAFDNNDTTNNETNTRRLAMQLSCSILAHHATCLADTLASELGILSGRRTTKTSSGSNNNIGGPVLITQPWKHVPSGTNGGITLWGCICSALGGTIIGISTIVLDFMSGLLSTSSTTSTVSSSTVSSSLIAIIVYTTIIGLLGSLIDSLLGATLQQTLYDPDTKLVYQVDDLKKKGNDKTKTSSSSSSIVVVCGRDILSNEMVNVVSVFITTFLGGWVLAEPIFNAFR